jgi:uncharacterized membrane protein
MRALCTAAAILAATVVVVVVVAVLCLEANRAHVVEQGVDSQELFDYLNRTRSVVTVYIRFDHG